MYVVAQGRIEDREMLNECVAEMVPTIQSGGGRILAIDEGPKVGEGVVGRPRTVILR